MLATYLLLLLISWVELNKILLNIVQGEWLKFLANTQDTYKYFHIEYYRTIYSLVNKT